MTSIDNATYCNDYTFDAASRRTRLMLILTFLLAGWLAHALGFS